MRIAPPAAAAISLDTRRRTDMTTPSRAVTSTDTVYVRTVRIAAVGEPVVDAVLVAGGSSAAWLS